MKAAIPELRKLGLKIYLETSGVLHQKLAEVIADVDIVSMDIKLPSSTGCRSFWAEHAAFLKIARRKECFVKMVISRKTSQADVVQAAKLVKCEDPDLLVILQPNSFEMNSGAVARCEQLQRVCQKDLSDVRIVPQMHKFMKLR